MTIKNVHGNTVDWLGDAIVSGRYAPGASVPPEQVLCDELGVSRTVVREAVKSLVAKGLLITGPKLGTRVLPDENWNLFDADVIGWRSKVGFSPEFMRDLQDLRRVVEPAAARMAAERATPEDLAEVEAAYEGMERAVYEGGDYITFDLRFHQGLMKAAHNRLLAQMSTALGALLRTSFEISTSREDGPRSSLGMHRELLDAVAARRADDAERAILRLIDGAREDIEQVLSSRRRLPSLAKPPPPLRRSRSQSPLANTISIKKETA